MDFHGLSRRELQALCKLNKIPANMTNVAMADALKALEIVKGIEEFMKPSESESVKSSIESPEKSEITSTAVPPTGGRTTTRRLTRRLPAGEVDIPKINMAETPAVAAPTTRRRAAVGATVRRKIENSLKESEEIEKEKKNVHESPVVVMASRRRGVKETSSVKHVYSTRRSTRLAAKDGYGKEISEAIKIESFAEEMDENVEIKSTEDKVELSEVTDENGFDLKVSSGKSDIEDVSEEKSKNGGDFEVVIKEEEANDTVIDAALGSKTEESADVEDFEVEIKEEEANDTAIDAALSSETDERVNADEKTGDVEDVLVEKSVNGGGLEVDIKKEEANDTVIDASLSSETEEHVNAEEKTGVVEDVLLEKSDNGGGLEVDIKEEEANDSAIDAALISEIEELVIAEEKTDDVEDVLVEKLKRGGDFEVDIKEEEVNITAIDVALSSETEESLNVEDKTGEDNKALDDDMEIKPEVDSEMSNEIDLLGGDGVEKLLDMENEVQENNGSEDVYASETLKDDEGSEFVADEDLESEFSEVEVGSDENMEADTADIIADLQSLETSYADENVNAEITASVQDDTEGNFAAPQNLMVQETHKESHTEFSLKPATVFAENVINAENFIMEMAGLQNDFSGNAAASALSSITPLKTKNPLTTTPMKKSAGGTPKTARRVFNVSDDKENVDSGRKLVVIKEEKPQKKVNNQKSLEEFSMRQLTKMFKEKLEITKTNKSKAHDDDTKVRETTRPALKALSENCRVMEPQN